MVGSDFSTKQQGGMRSLSRWAQGTRGRHLAGHVMHSTQAAGNTWNTWNGMHSTQTKGTHELMSFILMRS